MKRNVFSLSHYNNLSGNMGYLIPICWYDCIPGDSIRHSVSCLVRMAPILAPIMHPVKVRINHFFVPNRLLWTDFEDFITGGPDGDDDTEWPYIALNAVNASSMQGTLLDYLGVPCVNYTGTGIKINALPFRAYQLIYNEWFRDQDLINEYTVSKGNGQDSTTNTTLRRVSWEKDYFTVARTTEQKGSEITVGMADTADVIADGTPTWEGDYTASTYLKANTNGVVSSNAASQNEDWLRWIDPALLADLSTATGISINDLRLAVALQRYQEARQYYGSRYTEYLRSLGVRAQDGRLQRPEYVGGGKQIIQFSEVVQTAEGDDPVGMLRGHGIAAMRTRKAIKFIPEHGIFMSLLSVVPKAVYTTSLFKKWNRETKEDYFQKELQSIGDQAILNKELQADHSEPDETFGYIGRYDNYRYHPSSVHGDFLTDYDYWHLAREFSGDVALNQSFIECTPTTRVYAVPSADQMYVMCNCSTQARRPMIKSSAPKRLVI